MNRLFLMYSVTLLAFFTNSADNSFAEESIGKREELSVIEARGKVSFKELFSIEFKSFSAPKVLGTGSVVRIEAGGWISVDATSFSDTSAKSSVDKLMIKVLGPLEFRIDHDMFHEFKTKSVLSHLDLSKLKVESDDTPVKPDWDFDISDLWELDLASMIKAAPTKAGSDPNFGVGITTKAIRIMTPYDGQVFRSPLLPISIPIAWVDTDGDEYKNKNIVVKVTSLAKESQIDFSPGLRNKIELELDHYGTYEIVLLDPFSQRASKKVTFSLEDAKGIAKDDASKGEKVFPPSNATIIGKPTISFDFSRIVANGKTEVARLYELTLKQAGSKEENKMITAQTVVDITLKKPGSYEWSVSEMIPSSGSFSSLTDSTSKANEQGKLGSWNFKYESSGSKVSELDNAISVFSAQIKEARDQKKPAGSSTFIN